MRRKENTIGQKARRSTILYYWNNGHRSLSAIARITKIFVRTIKYNIATIKEHGTIEDRGRRERPRKLPTADNQALGQWIRRDIEVTAE